MPARAMLVESIIATGMTDARTRTYSTASPEPQTRSLKLSLPGRSHQILAEIAEQPQALIHGWNLGCSAEEVGRQCLWDEVSGLGMTLTRNRLVKYQQLWLHSCAQTLLTESMESQRSAGTQISTSSFRQRPYMIAFVYTSFKSSETEFYNGFVCVCRARVESW